MIFNLLKIRFLQIYREISGIGVFRFLIIFVLLMPMFIGFLYNKLSLPLYNQIITAVALLIVIMIHRKRKDYTFLIKISKLAAFTMYIEYLFFAFPLIILFIVTSQFLQLFLFSILLIPISFIVPSPKQAHVYSNFIKFIPTGLFEWQSGFRNNLATIIPLYITGILGLYNIWFSVVSVFLLLMTICSFYMENEPRKLLEAQELNAFNFIKTKLKYHVKYLIIFILPLFLLSTIHLEYWKYILFSFFTVINLFVGAILLKYGYYDSDVESGIPPLIGSIFYLLSIILPVSIILNILLYIKALRNLKYYLNAYN